jgi:uncharacterized protein YjbI with pentapeptide repeats
MEVDFTECDLTNARFDKCDLSGALFEFTILEKADFRTASSFIIDPDKNRIRQACFPLSGIRNLLAKYDIVIDESF